MHQTLASAARPLTAFPRFMRFPISAFTSGPFPLPFPAHFRFHFRSISASMSAFMSTFMSGPFPLSFPPCFPLSFPLSFPAHFCFHFRFHFRFMSAFISGSFPLPCPLSHFRSISAGANAFPLSFVHFRKMSGPFPVHCPSWQKSAQLSILIRN